MKIAFFNLLYFHREQRGGLGSHIGTVSRALARRGHDVTILTSGPPAELREDGVRVVRLGPVEPFRDARQLANPAFVLRRLVYLTRLTRRVLDEGFDVVEAADGGFEQLLLLRRRPGALVTKLHGNFRQIHSGSGALARLMNAIERRAVRGGDAVYASSVAQAERATRDWSLPRERIAVIPCGIDLGALDPVPRAELDRRYPALRGRRLVVASVGNSPGRKGARIFLRAARLAPGDDVAHVLVCAEPDLLAGTEPPAGVVLLPVLDRPFFHGLLAAAEAVVFPSHFETFSIATHEAMLLGRTVVVSRAIPLEGAARAYPRAIDLPALEPEPLAAAIRQALTAPRPAPDLEIQGRLEREFGIDGVADATLDLYRRAQAEWAARRPGLSRPPRESTPPVGGRR
jgi:glycosyltransferase involved in cell wall biosynthesis